MVNDNGKKIKPWKILLGILLLFLISLYLNDQSKNDLEYVPAYYPTQSVADLNAQFEAYQKQHNEMVEASDRAFDNWHRNFMEN